MMPRRTFVVVAVATLAAVVAAVAMAPAVLVASALRYASGGALTLADTHGTVWSGDGRLALDGSPWSPPVTWTLSAWGLALGEGRLTLGVGDAARPIAVDVVGEKVALGPGSFSVPAAALLAGARLPLPIAAGGDVVVTTPGAQMDFHQAAGSLDVDWRGARIADARGHVLNLGDVTLRFAARGAGFAGPVTNSGGDVALAGTLALGARAPAVDLTLTPRASPPPALLTQLAPFARPAPGGGIRILYNAHGG
ncbi:MAG: type II secretion system protein N [Proteobacteria bacterium]|nr:type II secretion system protein N [Pseudomonadota bacterium]